MAVYTPLTHRELESILKRYTLGELIDFEGIRDGIENTNYFVNTTGGEYVLTVFESLTKEDLFPYLKLMTELAKAGLPVPHPQPNQAGVFLARIKNKPAVITKRLPGHSPTQPTTRQCAEIGRALGYMHLQARNFTALPANPRGPHWREQTASTLMPYLPTEQANLLKHELKYQREHNHYAALPKGAIHADLFRDNSLFVGDELSGLIDFYGAGIDVLLYDVAVAVNDWCVTSDGSLDRRRLHALVNAYRQVRNFTAMEITVWPVVLRAAALRFWLSRLSHARSRNPSDTMPAKDPDEFQRILEKRRDENARLNLEEQLKACG